MKNLIRLFFVVCILACGGLHAQTLESLRDEIKRAEDDIARNTALLNDTKKSQKTTQTQLKLIRSRIVSRREIISSLDKQIDIITGDVKHKSRNIDSLNRQYAKIVDDYSRIIYASYKNYKLNNFLLFLFASKDFNDATRRIVFMQLYNRSRELKAEEIAAMSQGLKQQINILNKQRAEIDQVKVVRGNELASLGKDEQQYDQAVERLQEQEKNISKELAAKRRQLEKARKKIDQIIAEEAKKSKSKPRTATEEKEITALTGRFDQNKGKLPYPVKGGVIIDYYGVHQHPTLKGIVDNKGVTFAASLGSEARAVFEGDVMRVFFMMGYNECILLRHGSYLTLYTNLDLPSITVKAGDKVSINQSLGKLLPGDSDSGCTLYFEIWRENVNLNPEQWLRK